MVTPVRFYATLGTIVLCAYGGALCACGGSPADITGTYSTELTNGANSCPGTWTQGAMTSVSLDATQSGGTGTVAVTGVSGVFLQAALGASTFNVKIDGSHVTGSLLGTAEQTQGSCMYTWKAEIDATLDDNALQGTVTYTPQTNNDADCTSMSVQGCSRAQTFSGSRAPAG